MIYVGGYEKSAHLYDLFDDKENIEFFKSFTEGVDKVLDIGAGTGRIACPIAKEGVEVYCVEPSPSMIRELNKKIDQNENLRSKIRVDKCDSINFEFDEEFPLAIMSGVFDHFLNDDDRICTLLNINKHLIKGGRLVFDVFLGYMDKNESLDLAESKKEGNKEYKRFIRREKLDDDRMLITLVYKIYEDGDLVDTIEQSSEVGVIERKDLHRLLKETGFEIEQEFGDYNFRPYEEGDSFCIIEANKKE